uniref:Uncharacterized protein n=1 Tax=Panagrolaimus sp. ES5 TaxID=591445 RepID=A0AC34G622_9BILA
MYCQNSANCQQFYGTSSSCQNGACCSGGNTNPSGVFGLCYNGQQSQVRCTSNTGCGSSESCVNGLCCTKTGQEWQYACAGLTAVSSCYSGGTCGQNMVCTSSNYCCECQYGQTGGLCTQVN